MNIYRSVRCQDLSSIICLWWNDSYIYTQWEFGYSKNHFFNMTLVEWCNHGYRWGWSKLLDGLLITFSHRICVYGYKRLLWIVIYMYMYFVFTHSLFGQNFSIECKHSCQAYIYPVNDKLFGLVNFSRTGHECTWPESFLLPKSRDSQSLKVHTMWPKVSLKYRPQK